MPTGRALLAAGIPTPDLVGWVGSIPGAPTWWVPLLAAPVAILALLAPLTQRWAAGIALLVVAALGLATAFAAVGVSVAFAQSLAVPLWPGAGLSLAWLGALGGALAALDIGLAPRLAAVRSLAAVAVIARAGSCSRCPSLTAMARGTALLTNGPASTLPAYVERGGTREPRCRHDHHDAAERGRRLVAGGLGRQRDAERPGDDHLDAIHRDAPPIEEVATLTANLVTSAADDVIGELAADGISFVLLAPAAAARVRRRPRLPARRRDRARSARGSRCGRRDGQGHAVARDAARRAEGGGVRHPSTTSPGRSRSPSSPRSRSRCCWPFPTAASRREARRSPRVVGPHWQEGR